MDAMPTDYLEQIRDYGYVLLHEVLAPQEIEEAVRDLTAALSDPGGEDGPIRDRSGSLCAARNVLTLWPRARTIWQVPVLTNVLGQVLGRCYGLVRVLFFDKPPDHSWALPWHKDLTIAVQDNSLRS